MCYVSLGIVPWEELMRPPRSEELCGVTCAMAINNEITMMVLSTTDTII